MGKLKLLEISEAIECYREDVGSPRADEIDSTIIDMLADLRHFCDSKSLNFADLDRVAYRLYIREAAGRK